MNKTGIQRRVTFVGATKMPCSAGVQILAKMKDKLVVTRTQHQHQQHEKYMHHLEEQEVEDNKNWMDEVSTQQNIDQQYNSFNFKGIIGWGIIAVGYLIGSAVFLKIQKTVALLFCCGCFLGVLWEVPLSFPGWQSDPKQLLKVLYPKYLFLLLPYFFWDGLILTIGYWIVKSCLAPPHFTVFSWLEFCIVIVWGQVSSLLVEVFAAVFNLWSYKPSKWNPLLFKVNETPITFMPQAIWIAASTIFYLITLYVTNNI
eukprot:TRINITY_DN3098_c0_g2_i2.p2 TRINITY_DN3098_c0_g2~~TRINITY_DN3098_c0_g2_i2.p2  ORF type:complete len:257 (-),score=9.17 TRINITY_DN3098_c0_g2_i2:314-1084(-)